MAVSFISSITILGYPVQSYIYGTVIVWFGLSTAVQVVIACIYYIPLFHRLKIVSVYEVSRPIIHFYTGLWLMFYDFFSFMLWYTLHNHKHFLIITIMRCMTKYWCILILQAKLNWLIVLHLLIIVVLGNAISQKHTTTGFFCCCFCDGEYWMHYSLAQMSKNVIEIKL